jgi:hypothetical protein
MFWRCGAGAVASCLLSAGEANAGNGIVITSGVTISQVGDVPHAKRPEQNVTMVGYKYSYYGVFWIDIWTSDGTYCVYDGDKYDPIDPAAAAYLLDKSEGSLSRPYLYICPSGWLLVGGLVVVWIVVEMRDNRRASVLSQLFQHPEYQMALQVLNAECAKAPSGGADDTSTEAGWAAAAGHEDRHRIAFAAAVQHLVKSGIPWDGAERNLTLIIQALCQTTQQL